MNILFFKQKTAYEMRISDWSSGVCSSDLSGSRSSARRNTKGALRRLRFPGERLVVSGGAQLAEEVETRRGDDQFGLRLGKIEFRAGTGQTLFALVLRSLRGSFVDILGAPRGIGEHRPQIGRAAGRERVGQYV